MFRADLPAGIQGCKESIEYTKPYYLFIWNGNEDKSSRMRGKVFKVDFFNNLAQPC